jgi:hypothetical protein
VPYNVSTYRWTKWEAFYFENFDDPLDHHYNLMIDSGADPEEVVSNPNSCEFIFIKIMRKSAKLWLKSLLFKQFVDMWPRLTRHL